MLWGAMGQQPEQDSGAVAPVKRGPWRLVVRTVTKAWFGDIFSEAAEAAFWQTLSLPPLLLGLLGLLSFVGDWFGPQLVTAVETKILSFCHSIFSQNVVDQIIAPTLVGILTGAHTEVASIGFLISLWAGSSAMASFVDAITAAYGQHDVRHPVWQRIFALFMYVVGLLLAVIGLPVLALGPDLLATVVPGQWRPLVQQLLSTFYYPVMAVLLVLALTTLYKVALPRKLPWHRGLPGAGLAMVMFLLSSIGLRLYIGWITTTGYTYGALATPIAFLLFTFFLGMAIVVGAHFNSAIEELWPAKMTRRQRRRWRRLELERAAVQIRAGEQAKQWLDSQPEQETAELNNGSSVLKNVTEKWQAPSPADVNDTEQLKRPSAGRQSK
ncbi:YihY/virulence factor BrkB family protein [Kutzneria sp. CA-103260]|uniref:YihY/virulence factor BrkB family protein n=1 Tax=Kutzneria sp. CA-103260 TaxID=2802641 RepID=UPI001BF17076|nr:ribonuclease BN [Kutzneria sp. CA-103260]